MANRLSLSATVIYIEEADLLSFTQEYVTLANHLSESDLAGLRASLTH